MATPNLTGSLPTMNIEAWAASALASLSISSTAPSTTDPPMAIPLDDPLSTASKSPPRAPPRTLSLTMSPGVARLQREPLRRRDTFLQGREGTRRRRRWENGKP